MSTQRQFLEVLDRDTAWQRFEQSLRLDPVGEEHVPLDRALGRVLSQNVRAEIDVPAFDRANVDGFALPAANTAGASELAPCRLRLLATVITPGTAPACALNAGEAAAIATGGMLPRGADAVIMVEHTDVEHGTLLVRKAVAPAAGFTSAGNDVARGETVLRAGELLTSRETGVLAAIGRAEVAAFRRPRVAILSTGDELAAPGDPLPTAGVYDSNGRVLSDAVTELGGEPLYLGIVRDDLEQLRARLHEALAASDLVLLSGGTSKGDGDLSYRAVAELTDPGIVAHGVALKPGKPLCLAVTRGQGVVVLPGFPTSALFTFHEFVAPVIRRLAGRAAPDSPRASSLEGQSAQVQARLAVKLQSEIGRTEYVLVNLFDRACPPHAPEFVAFPLGKGSGSVTTFGQADGFLTLDRHEEIVAAGETRSVTLLGRDIRPADLLVIGSHCVGIDLLLSRLTRQGWRTKFLAVGSQAGLAAAQRGDCDVAGLHLYDPATHTYNTPFITPEIELVRGYDRLQGVVYRRGDARFEELAAPAAMLRAITDPACRMMNRNVGSGTRLLIDRLLQGQQPPGYAAQPRSHNAVAAAVAQRRADWGVAIAHVATAAGLGFLPLEREHFDFAIPRSRANRPAVQAFRRLLDDAEVRRELKELGF